MKRMLKQDLNSILSPESDAREYFEYLNQEFGTQEEIEKRYEKRPELGWSWAYHFKDQREHELFPYCKRCPDKNEPLQ